MKQRPFFCLFPVFILLMVFSGCRGTVVFVSDPVWEGYLMSVPGAEPDWQQALKSGRYRVVSLDGPPGGEIWPELMEKYKPEFIFWEPLWLKEAVEFGLGQDEIRSLVPGDLSQRPGGTRNLTYLMEDRIEAFGELGGFLHENWPLETKILAFFYTGNKVRREERLNFITALDSGSRPGYQEFLLDSEKDLADAEFFLKKSLQNSPDLVILSAGGNNSVFYDLMENKDIKIFIEAPFPLMDSDPRIIGSFRYPRLKKIKEVLAVSPETWETEYRVTVELEWAGVP